MSLVDKDCINAHFVKVLHLVSPPVKLFLCSCRYVLFYLFLSLCILFLCLWCRTFSASQSFSEFGHFNLDILQFLFSLHQLIFIYTGFLHHFNGVLLFFYAFLNECKLSFRTVRNHFKCRLRYDNHIPVAILDASVKCSSAFRCSVSFSYGKYLCIWIEFLCVCHKLRYGSVLYHYHRFLCSTEPAHFHCG